MIRFHAFAINSCTVQRCCILIFLGYGNYFIIIICLLLSTLSVIPLFLTIPNFLALSIKPTITAFNGTYNMTLYSLTVITSIIYTYVDKIFPLKWSMLAESNNQTLFKLNIWLYSFFLKLVPCSLLSIITCLLIKALMKVRC